MWMIRGGSSSSSETAKGDESAEEKVTLISSLKEGEPDKPLKEKVSLIGEGEPDEFLEGVGDSVHAMH